MAEKKESKRTKELKDKLTREPVRCWDAFSTAEREKAYTYAHAYKEFLNQVQTER